MEEKKDATYFKQLAHQLMFDLSDEEAENIVIIKKSSHCAELFEIKI